MHTLGRTPCEALTGWLLTRSQQTTGSLCNNEATSDLYSLNYLLICLTQKSPHRSLKSQCYKICFYFTICVSKKQTKLNFAQNNNVLRKLQNLNDTTDCYTQSPYTSQQTALSLHPVYFSFLIRLYHVNSSPDCHLLVHWLICYSE